MSSPYDIGFGKINSYQKQVLQECIEKKKGGLSLPMGYGKTIIGTLLGLKLSDGKKSLMIMSKSLIGNFINEFKKFFGESLIYQVLHQEYIKGKKLENFILNKDTMIIITTPEVISKVYKKNGIEEKIVNVSRETHFGHLEHNRIDYVNPVKPLGVNNIGANILYSIEWGCLIVDEIQRYTNILADNARGIASIYSKFRWGLSGTIFDEPKIEKILGYYTILNLPDFPRNLKGAKNFVQRGKFAGTRSTMVVRDKVEFVTLPDINQTIIQHTLSYEETQIYINMKTMIRNIRTKISSSSGVSKRQFSAQLLAMITYMRQSIVSPLIPIANIFLDMYDLKNSSDLSKKIFNTIVTPDIKNYIKNEKNVISSRIKEVLNIVNKHDNEKLVIFTCFRTSLDLLKNLIKDRQVLTITGNQSAEKRGSIVKEFNDNKNNAVFLLTYDIGCEGLNLQSSSTVLLVDLSWNSAKSSQAIARVLRQGQNADKVNIYYFTSNLSMEEQMFRKHLEKSRVIDEIESGNSKLDIKSIVTKDIVNVLDLEDNVELMKRITM